MGQTALESAVRRGVPLVQLTVCFREGVDGDVATNQLNRLADDFDLYTKPWYDNPRLRTGLATKEALERLFRWRLKRVNLERFNEQTGNWDHWPDVYRWEEVSKPDLEHAGLSNTIEEIGISQPGAGDDGQWYE